MSFDPLLTGPDDAEMVQLRAGAGVVQNPNGVWFLARYDDVLAATKDVDTFNASFREPGVVVPDEEQFINEIAEPRHGQVRRIINGAIATHKLGGVEPFCTALCHRLLDDLLAREGTVDLVGKLRDADPEQRDRHAARRAPEDFDRCAAWSDEVVQGTYPTKYRNERGEGLAGAHPELTAYVDEQIAMRHAQPRDDFISLLLEIEVDGRRLTDVEARTQLVFLLISGNETTRHLISNLLWTLATTDGLLERLRSRPRPDRCRDRGITAARPADQVPHAHLHRRHRRARLADLPTRQDRLRHRVGATATGRSSTSPTTSVWIAPIPAVISASGRPPRLPGCCAGASSRRGSRSTCSSIASPRSRPSTAPGTRTCPCSGRTARRCVLVELRPSA